MPRTIFIVVILLVSYGCVLLYFYPPLDDLFGYEEFNDPESKDAPAFYISLIYVAFFVVLSFFFVKKNGWKKSWYFIIGLLIMSILFSINATEFLNKENYYRAFDEVEWNKTTDKKPLEMARWMEKNAYGMGWHKNEVIQYLGGANNTNLNTEHNLIRFQLEHPSGYLDYIFDHGKAIRIHMWCACD